VDWEPGASAIGKGSPSTVYIGGGERCAGAINPKLALRGAAARVARFVTVATSKTNLLFYQ